MLSCRVQLLALLGGQALAPDVELTAESATSCGVDFGGSFWLPHRSIAALGMGSKTCSGQCGSVTLGLSGNASTNGVYNLAEVRVDGSDACSVCAGCSTVLVGLEGVALPRGYKPGVTASVTYSRTPAAHPRPGPDLPPGPLPPRPGPPSPGPAPPPVRCPCSDPALCRPLPPHAQPKPGADEVFAFTSFSFAGSGQPGGRANWTAIKHLNWTKITAFAPFERLDAHYGKQYTDAWCTAHEHGARLLTNGHQGWNGVQCPVNRFLGWAQKHNPQMHNRTAVRAWASETAECVAASGWDGVLQDMEGMGWPGLTAAQAAKERASITFAVW